MTSDPADDDDALGRALQQALALREAPAAVLRAAVQLWPEHGIGLAGAVRRVMAALSFDSAAGGLQLSSRGGGGASRHLLFSAEGRDIDLRVTSADDGYQISGQVLGPDESGVVELARADDGAAPVVSAALDALGVFAVRGLGAGRYDIQLVLGEATVVLPPVEVGTLPPLPSSRDA